MSDGLWFGVRKADNGVVLEVARKNEAGALVLERQHVYQDLEHEVASVHAFCHMLDDITERYGPKSGKAEIEIKIIEVESGGPNYDYSGGDRHPDDESQVIHRQPSKPLVMRTEAGTVECVKSWRYKDGPKAFVKGERYSYDAYVENGNSMYRIYNRDFGLSSPFIFQRKDFKKHFDRPFAIKKSGEKKKLVKRKD